MIVCHADEKHPHVHVLLNRVSPTDGRMLSSSNEKNALSALALAYEKEGGTVLCKQREVNAERRKKGEFVRGEKDLPRPEYEAMRAEQKEIEQEVPARLLEEHAPVIAEVRATIRSRLRERLDGIKQAFRPQWRALYQEQRAEAEVERQEKKGHVARLAAWLGEKTGLQGIKLPFQRHSVPDLQQTEVLQTRKQRADRATLGKEYQGESRKAFGEARQVYELKVKSLMLRSDIAQAAKPEVKAEIKPTPEPPAAKPLTAAQQRALDLVKEVRATEGPKPKVPQPKVQQRDFQL